MNLKKDKYIKKCFSKSRQHKPWQGDLVLNIQLFLNRPPSQPVASHWFSRWSEYTWCWSESNYAINDLVLIFCWEDFKIFKSWLYSSKVRFSEHQWINEARKLFIKPNKMILYLTMVNQWYNTTYSFEGR